MILYFTPGACSLGPHISLREAGLDFDLAEVDLRTHKTKDGRDFYEISPKGYVPALALDDGQLITENIAIHSWISEQAPKLVPAGPLGRTRMLEMLTYISTEIHKSFKPFFNPAATADDKAAAGKLITKRLSFIAERMRHDYVLGPDFTPADAYLFVTLTWAVKNNIQLPGALPAYMERMKARPAVKTTLDVEQKARAAA